MRVARRGLLLVLVAAAFPPTGASTLQGEDIESLWGANRGSLEGTFTRSDKLTERAAPIDPLDQATPFSIRFRFQTSGQGTYGAVVYVGVRRAGADYNRDGAGVMLFRHSEKRGLVGSAFVWDSEGNGHNSRQVPLKYGVPYDVSCVYSPAAGTLSVTFFRAGSGQPVSEPTVLKLPPDAKWSADCLACWNYADGHPVAGRLTVLLDDLQINDKPALTFDTSLEELPMGDNEHFKWHQEPLPPLILELTAPREVFSEDVTFEAGVRAGLTGKVRFALKTYAGKTVWSKVGAIADGKASVVLRGEEAAKMEKGSRVLVATVNGERERSAYAAVRLRGRILRDVTATPSDIRPGDEIVITDMSLLRPSSAISRRSEKGKWWLREYTIDGEPGRHSLVCVEEQDLDDPASCLAPPLRLPLKLDGWYEVWVRTYRHREGGGIDVRLSGQEQFLHADPLQVGTTPDQPKPRYGALVDVLYRAEDLTGQDLLFQQPYGTYNSESKLCNASLAGVRLVKLSQEQVQRLKRERAREDVKIIGYDNDGYSYFFRWGVENTDCIARLLEPLRDQSAAFLNISLAGVGGLIIPTPYTGMYQLQGHTRDGDFRANTFFRWCFGNNVNILDVLTDYGHKVGVKVFASLMMERSFSPDDVMRAHPQWRIKRGPGTWDYANPQVQDYQVKKIAWIIKNHDIDGFIVDFTRYGHYFNEDEPNKFEHMNTFLRKLRAAVDEVNAGKERKVLLCGSFGDRSWHLLHWGTGKLEDQGLDVKTWLKEGLFDIIMPEGPTAMDFVQMAKGTSTRVWPRKVQGVSFATHTKVNGQLGPKQIEKGAKAWLDGGADGIFFFNHETWTTLGRVGFKEELNLRTKVDDVYGYREGPVITFATWYPNMEERNAQRKTFKPLAIQSDSDRNVDGELVIPVCNTFSHPVSAEVKWTIPADAGPWTIEPPAGNVPIAPGRDGRIAFHLKGHAPTQASVPAAEIELASGGQAVFRHRLPVRAVPMTICRKTTAPPTMDGNLTDRTWAEAGGLKEFPIFLVGSETGALERIRTAAAYDDQHLYLALEIPPALAPAETDEALERDDAAIFQTDNLQLLIDPTGFEQEYMQFVVTASGAQAGARSYYDSFAGHFVTKRDWNAEWTAAAASREESWLVELAIPFEALGTVPDTGDVWRLNLVVNSRGGQEKARTWSWSSPEPAFHRPKCFGAVEFK